MSNLPILAGIELVKLLLLLAFQEAQRANMTQAEIDEAFQIALAKFKENRPNKIPDV